MHQQKRTRRQQIALRSFTYGMMTIAVAIGAAFTLALAMGFRFDFRSGQISQVALLQFNSFPTGASIDINGKRLSSNTPTRTNIQSGKTTATMSLSGYRTWSKTVDMSPSSVRWLNYARLIPDNVTSESIKNFSGVGQMMASPDQHWLILTTGANNRDIILADISNPQKVKFANFTLDPNSVTAPAENQTENFEIVEWDQGSRYVLLKHTVGDTTEFLRVDRQNLTDTRNLSKDFNMNIAEAHFSGNSGNVFFGLTGTDLRKFDYGNNTVSAPLVGGVQNYRAYENGKLAFVSLETKDAKTTQNVGIYNDGQIQIVKTFTDQKPTMAEFSRYNGTDYLAIARDETVTIYPSPLDSSNKTEPISLKSPDGIDIFDFSPTGRFMMAAHGSKIVSYDLEMNEHYSFELAEDAKSLSWIDNYHILDTSGGSIALVEFDGGNRQSIVSGRMTAVLSSNGKYLFSISDAASGVVLQQSQMVVN